MLLSGLHHRVFRGLGAPAPCKRPALVRASRRGGRKGRGGRAGDEEWAGESSRPDEFEWWKRQPGDDDWVERREPTGGDRGERGSGERGGGERGDRGGRRRGDYAPGPSRRGRGGGERGGGWGRDARPRGRGRGRDDGSDGDDDDDAGRGWWEVPRKEREATHAAEPLEKWQEERLVVAFAVGRRRVSVQELAAELSLDRSEVTDWFKRHTALPKEERDALQAPLAAEIATESAADEARRAEARAARAAAAPAAPAGRRADGQPRGREQRQQRQDQQQQQQAWEGGVTGPGAAPAAGSLLAPSKGADTGFVPFKERHGAGGLGGPRRLAADALRTLESLYARSPYPSRELMQSVCDMHRLPRDMAQEWFSQRREAEGRPHDPRAAKRLAEQAARAAAAAAGGGGTAGGGGGGAGRPPPRGPTPGEEEQLLRLMRAAAAEAAVTGGGDGNGYASRGQRSGADRDAAAEAAAAPAKRVAVTAREMAAMRSSLPSPRKFKGAKLAEQLEIKQTASSVEIGGVQYVVKSGAAEWRRAWHRRRAARGAGGGVPAARLDFVGWYAAAAARAAREP